MSVSFAQGNASLSLPSPAANALTAPVTPERRVPVVDKTRIDPKMLEVAQGMEGMFLDYMMKVMRETVPKQEGDLESPATRIYRGMQDSEFAKRAAQAGGIGLADQIIAYYESQRYTLPRGHGVPVARNGAVPPVNGSSAEAAKAVQGVSHEGQPVHE